MAEGDRRRPPPAPGYDHPHSICEAVDLTSLRLLFVLTLFLLVGFTVSFGRALGLESAPWIVSLWLAWGLGVAWVRARGWS
jgi:hypothetical protein